MQRSICGTEVENLWNSKSISNNIKNKFKIIGVVFCPNTRCTPGLVLHPVCELPNKCVCQITNKWDLKINVFARTWTSRSFHQKAMSTYLPSCPLQPASDGVHQIHPSPAFFFHQNPIFWMGVRPRQILGTHINWNNFRRPPFIHRPTNIAANMALAGDQPGANIVVQLCRQDRNTNKLLTSIQPVTNMSVLARNWFNASLVKSKVGMWEHIYHSIQTYSQADH